MTVHRLLEIFHAPSEIFAASEKALLETDLLKPSMRKALTASKNPVMLQKRFDSMQRKGIRFFSIASEGYPDILRQIYDPPVALYVRGHLPESGELMMAVVGGRRCSIWHRQCSP